MSTIVVAEIYPQLTRPTLSIIVDYYDLKRRRALLFNKRHQQTFKLTRSAVRGDADAHLWIRSFSIPPRPLKVPSRRRTHRGTLTANSPCCTKSLLNQLVAFQTHMHSVERRFSSSLSIETADALLSAI